MSDTKTTESPREKPLAAITAAIDKAVPGWPLGVVYRLSEGLKCIRLARDILEESKQTIEDKDLAKDPSIIEAVKAVCDEGCAFAKALGSLSGMIGVNLAVEPSESKNGIGRPWKEPVWSGPDSPGRVAGKNEIIRYLLVSPEGTEWTYDVHESKNPKYSQQQIQAMLAKIRMHSAGDESELIEYVGWRILDEDEMTPTLTCEYAGLMELIHEHIPELP